MNKMNKILLSVVVVLLLVLIGFVVWKEVAGKPSYAAVYLKTGDLYFGKLVRFPYFGLKQPYLFQVNQSNKDNPLSVQRFKNVFWGPEDYLKINREEVVWYTQLRSDSELAKVFETNPDLVPPQGQQQQAPAPQAIPEPEPQTKK
ncbi:MAG: hypothetical protein WCV80_01625 [Candidatus Paceibacterota bacterium]|jgi:hypothetical protein